MLPLCVRTVHNPDSLKAYQRGLGLKMVGGLEPAIAHILRTTQKPMYSRILSRFQHCWEVAEPLRSGAPREEDGFIEKAQRRSLPLPLPLPLSLSLLPSCQEVSSLLHTCSSHDLVLTTDPSNKAIDMDGKLQSHKRREAIPLYAEDLRHLVNEWKAE